MELLPTPQSFLEGLTFGESPRWHEGRLWYSDYFRHQVRAASLDGIEEVIVEVPSQPSGLGWLPNGDLLAVSMLDRRVLRFDGSALHLHADLSEIATSHCNDMTTDLQGRAYVGNFGFDLHAGADVTPATVALVHPDGAVEAAADNLQFPNGAVITPDGNTYIVGESFGCQFTAFDVGDNGHLKNRRLWAAVPGMIPDGCCMDAEGGIWFADAVGKAALRVLEGGEITHRVNTELNCYAVMLGGEDRKTLFLVTAPGLHPDEVSGRYQGRIEMVTVEIPGVGFP
ncbi:MAG: SMP-30/gluconolactonase/LRE family protein [Acidimicrobiia bacterium]|nr:SMP-30/gluconolactonase/LRE family protein [Acidimicrobiia bacterium]MYC58455.1 SMP-30/gluconolactonase/LRE family protein [Acidimicrobiia bacterium]MYG94213.1 SMP-30/gluconolactonase/LRE family protein [Acidimicrobiia bacterium]MYI30439.1 SMP-30/gluconolactonase/LRE family protein [Acidimicrobiia bacterium]